MKSFTTHFETLPPAQRRLLPHLQPLEKLGFVLYGGTALALRLGHRESVDFDFFNERALDRDNLLRLPVFENATILQDEPDSLGAIVRRDDIDVNISLFGSISFGRVGEPERSDDGSLVVASLDDLFGTKLKVLLQRVEAKDYLDVIALIENGASLERALGTARILFGRTFQPAESLRALTYFGEGDLRAISSEMRRLLETRVASCGPVPDLPILNQRLSGDDVI